METTERKTPMLTLHRGSAPYGIGALHDLQHDDHEHQADMARLCGADTSDAAELGEGAGVLLWPLAIIAVVAVGSLLVAVFA